MRVSINAICAPHASISSVNSPQTCCTSHFTCSCALVITGDNNDNRHFCATLQWRRIEACVFNHSVHVSTLLTLWVIWTLPIPRYNYGVNAFQPSIYILTGSGLHGRFNLQSLCIQELENCFRNIISFIYYKAHYYDNYYNFYGLRNE